MLSTLFFPPTAGNKKIPSICFDHKRTKLKPCFWYFSAIEIYCWIPIKYQIENRIDGITLNIRVNKRGKTKILWEIWSVKTLPSFFLSKKPGELISTFLIGDYQGEIGPVASLWKIRLWLFLQQSLSLLTKKKKQKTLGRTNNSPRKCDTVETKMSSYLGLQLTLGQFELISRFEYMRKKRFKGLVWCILGVHVVHNLDMRRINAGVFQLRPNGFSPG